MNLLKTTFICAALLMISCNSDDDPLSVRILGTYDLLSVVSSGCDDPDENIDYTEVDNNGCVSVQDVNICNVFIQFMNDGTAIETYTEDGTQYSDEFTYTVNDDNKTISLCESPGDCITMSEDIDVITRTFFDDGCIIIIKYKRS